jgi:hypothetical protein
LIIPVILLLCSYLLRAGKSNVEKTRQKKDGEDKNKKNQRMQEVEKDPGKKNTAADRQNKSGRGMGKK